MTKRHPHFEVLRTEDGYFARLVAANGRIVWVTPGILSKKSQAIRAVDLVVEAAGGSGVIEVREVDLRHPEDR